MIDETGILDGVNLFNQDGITKMIHLVNDKLTEWGAKLIIRDPLLPPSLENDADILFDSDEDMVRFILTWS